MRTLMPGSGCPILAALAADLAELRGAEVARVHGDDRRTFGAAIPFQRTNAEAVFEGDSDAFGQLLRTDQHISQAAKVFGRQRRM